MSEEKGCYYSVKAGESLFKIAKRFRLASWTEIYNHKNNDIIFRNPESRSFNKPNLIYPDDTIWIPRADSNTAACPSGMSGKFIAIANLTVQVVEIVNHAEQPIKDAIINVKGIGNDYTGENGFVYFGRISPGIYEIVAEKEGYTIAQELSQKMVKVPFGKTTVATIFLELELDQFSSENSTKYIDQGDENKVIFLTFDDGPEAGTKETYELLKELNVPGAFFFVGENVTNYELNIEKGFFKKIYHDPNILIGNHSQTQSHQFYDSYYKYGLRINKETLEPDAWKDHPTMRRAVLMDFEYANLSFTEVLTKKRISRPVDYNYDFRGKFDLTKLTGYSRFLTARMPGTNAWRLGEDISSEPWGASNRADEADDLYKNGYKIYGWDHEWEMSFEIPELQRREYRTDPKKPLEMRDGYLDLYNEKLIELDRPKETGEEVFEKVKDEFEEWFPDTQKPNKLILLMHERAFRRYKKGQEKKYINYLRKFIELCKKEGYKFDVLENY